jgi:hypothetical protein
VSIVDGRGWLRGRAESRRRRDRRNIRRTRNVIVLGDLDFNFVLLVVNGDL